VTDLERLLRDQQTQASTAEDKAADLSERLTRAEERIAQLKKVADTLPDLRDAATAARGQADDALAKIKALERDVQSRDRELTAARTALNSAQGGRAELVSQ